MMPWQDREQRDGVWIVTQEDSDQVTPGEYTNAHEQVCVPI